MCTLSNLFNLTNYDEKKTFYRKYKKITHIYGFLTGVFLLISFVLTFTLNCEDCNLEVMPIVSSSMFIFYLFLLFAQYWIKDWLEIKDPVEDGKEAWIIAIDLAVIEVFPRMCERDQTRVANAFYEISIIYEKDLRRFINSRSYHFCTCFKNKRKRERAKARVLTIIHEMHSSLLNQGVNFIEHNYGKEIEKLYKIFKLMIDITNEPSRREIALFFNKIQRMRQNQRHQTIQRSIEHRLSTYSRIDLDGEV